MNNEQTTKKTVDDLMRGDVIRYRGFEYVIDMRRGSGHPNVVAVIVHRPGRSARRVLRFTKTESVEVL